MNNILPPWARQEAKEIFKKRKLIICGSVARAETRVLARYADVVAVVDDFNSGDLFGIPIITSDAWIERAKSDKTIVSCILTPHRP
ncbi:MAG: hypothetical protein SFW62_03260, partial [Alphaproteobacteria bacterium]|nr:hypothetical protein [Alphaproteobacteria bacterium]